MLEELARQACDQIERWALHDRVQPSTIARAAHNVGVPMEYVLAERERRVRARRTPEKSEGA